MKEPQLSFTYPKPLTRAALETTWEIDLHVFSQKWSFFKLHSEPTTIF